MTLIAFLGLALAAAVSFADAWAISFARQTRSLPLDALRAITDVGEVQWYLVPAGLLILALSLIDWTGRPRRARARLALLFGQGLFAFASIASAQLLTRLLKPLFGRSRPALIHEGGPLQFDFFRFGELYWSFPSGHATTSGALTAILMLWFPRARFAVLPLGIALALSRIAADAHYPSDVAAGFFIGFIVTLFLARWLAARGLVFRLAGRRLFPMMRFARVRSA